MFTGRGISVARQGLHVLRKQRLTVRNLSVSNQCKARQEQKADGPIPFSSSKAASWSLSSTTISPKRDIPWYQPVSISLSILVFLVYFLFLREENDLDRELNYSLFERVPQLEEHQIKVALDYNRRQGIDTRQLEERLKEIQQEKNQKTV